MTGDETPSKQDIAEEGFGVFSTVFADFLDNTPGSSNTAVIQIALYYRAGVEHASMLSEGVYHVIRAWSLSIASRGTKMTRESLIPSKYTSLGRNLMSTITRRSSRKC